MFGGMKLRVVSLFKWHITDERMSSGGLHSPTFRKARRLKRELNLNINTKPAITYTHCYGLGAVLKTKFYKYGNIKN